MAKIVEAAVDQAGAAPALFGLVSARDLNALVSSILFAILLAALPALYRFFTAGVGEFFV